MRYRSTTSVKLWRGAFIAALLAGSLSLSAQTVSTPSPRSHRRSARSAVLRMVADVQPDTDLAKSMNEAQLLEESREAGLLTDWHLCGIYGRGREEDFARAFAPEKAAVKRRNQSGNQSEHYELVFPEGRFTLPSSMAARKGVFYASSNTYLSSGGQYNVYLESGAEAAVFVDGQRVLESGPKTDGVLRGTIHADKGYHSVMVKFTAQAAPFRVAILPPNSGSRRKNNTPFLQAAPASENLLAMYEVHRRPQNS